jgi:hypothetical protein
MDIIIVIKMQHTKKKDKNITYVIRRERDRQTYLRPTEKGNTHTRTHARTHASTHLCLCSSVRFGRLHSVATSTSAKGIMGAVTLFASYTVTWYDFTPE